MTSTAPFDGAAATSGPQPGAAVSSTAAWTPQRLHALGTVTTVPVAASIFGLSRSVAYELVRTGQFPVPILRFGSRYRVPVRPILAALHMPTDETQAPPT